MKYSLWDTALLVVWTTNLWSLGVIGGSAFWFWCGLIAVAWGLLSPLDLAYLRRITGMER